MLENKIQVGRAEKKMTQQQLADAVGVSRQTIVALEKNKYNPSLILAFKISETLGKEITCVFEYKEEK
ncbi:helix-turn-helix transcriptional regulator [Metasolibacillus meyeri]|uniref:Helix-turn-helix transcriptional regulator n=1 Tax=Metasolibacillus meyeri TaxID=1071052 RepID=A0AAW9NLN3_9BACL|nr:helix-turn-helix transcriptional regulator [Metasolibacillus meyeri]MEC1177351.1 helix-turn-helix transcriptional regulator [Metasolibacillus meyeri]